MPAAAIAVYVEGEPVPWARPRFGRNRTTGKRQVYNAAGHSSYKETLAWTLRSAMRGAAPLDGAVRVDIAVVLAPPASWAAAVRDAAIRGSIVPAVKPDLDNFEKIALDACNGIVYRDDAQVVSKTSCKRYGERPSLTITVTPLECP